MSRSSSGGFLACTTLMEHNADEGLYRASLAGDIRAVSDNQRDARLILAERLERVAQELRR
jgi:hypothetical protein